MAGKVYTVRSNLSFLFIYDCRRYIDDVFFTSNESKETIEYILKQANNFHPNIKLQGEIGKRVNFLDVSIENKNGILSTSVYHKEAAEPYVVPFKSDHPRHTFGNIVKAALARAVRYSSTLKFFDNERRNIKLTLLYNGFVDYFSSNFPIHSYHYLAIHHTLFMLTFKSSFQPIMSKHPLSCH